MASHAKPSNPNITYELSPETRAQYEQEAKRTDQTIGQVALRHVTQRIQNAKRHNPNHPPGAETC